MAQPMRRGWSTGACAAAAAVAAAKAVLSPKRVVAHTTVVLPRRQGVLVTMMPIRRAHRLGEESERMMARAWVVKDAGDDPDITHGAFVSVRIDFGSPPLRHTATATDADTDAPKRIIQAVLAQEHDTIVFLRARGVGIVTKAGLPTPVGEAAISPSPRRYIAENIRYACQRAGFLLPRGEGGGEAKPMASEPRERANRLSPSSGQSCSDTLVTKMPITVAIGIAGGAAMAQQTWNPRLGIVGGLSVLGTTGVVIPYSCSAWIHSIHRGIDVARANQFPLVGAATGKTSENTLMQSFGLPPEAILDMGDFIGGMTKYLQRYPVPALIVCGGMGKMAKYAQGANDLHNKRSTVNLPDLLEWADDDDRLRLAAGEYVSTAALVGALARPQILLQRMAERCHHRMAGHLPECRVRIVLVDRAGEIVAQHPLSDS
ncbi:MAG: cobalt-precorrin-5B (C(1))-methyltransferase [Alphaproteobacteria bacterium]|nr:cobalt-precorrin-5B (C(1))-methyltransferase [Alphaproteobacteria bacterium]